jgi:hypothetical protein
MITDKNILILCALFLMGVAFGQNESPKPNEGQITEIIIDLNDEAGIALAQIEKYNGLKRGQFFRLRIDNVNTYLYDVNVTNEDVDQSAALPESLLDLVDFGGLKSSLVHLSSVSGVVKEFVALESNTGLQRLDPGKVQTLENLKKYFAGTKSDYKSAFNEVGDRYIEVDALFVRAESYQNAMTTVERGVFGAVPSKNDIKTVLKSFDETKAGIITIKEGLAQEMPGI